MRGMIFNDDGEMSPEERVAVFNRCHQWPAVIWPLL